MTRPYPIWIFLAALLAADLAFAQAGGGRDAGGSVNMGRGRTTWLTDAEIATEKMKEFEVSLERLSLEEWKEASVAWVAFELDKEARRITLPQTYHVGSVTADRRSEVETGGAEWEPAFEIAFPKKAPKEIELTMTDLQATKVSCPLGEAVKKEKGLLGVFIHDNALHCIFREQAAEDEDTAPA